MFNGSFPISGMQAVYIPISYQSHNKHWHICPLQLAVAADSPQDVIQEVHWLRCSCTIQPPQFRQTSFYDRRCFCCKAGNFSLLIVFLLVMIVFQYFQTNSANKRNKGYSTLVVWGNCFRSLPSLISFAQFSRTCNNLSLVRSTVIRGGNNYKSNTISKQAFFSKVQKVPSALVLHQSPV